MNQSKLLNRRRHARAITPSTTETTQNRLPLRQKRRQHRRVGPQMPTAPAGTAAPPCDSGIDAETVKALTGGLFRHVRDAFALRAEDDSMSDARVHEGDVVLLERAQAAADGQLVAIRLLDCAGTILRRIYHDNGLVRLQPEDRQLPPVMVTPGSFELKGRVLAIVRQRA